LANPSRAPNLKTLAPAVAKYYRKPKILGSFPSPRPLHFFFWWDLMMGFGELQLHAKFEVAGIIYYGNIREFVLKGHIRFFSHP